MCCLTLRYMTVLGQYMVVLEFHHAGALLQQSLDTDCPISVVLPGLEELAFLCSLFLFLVSCHFLPADKLGMNPSKNCLLMEVIDKAIEWQGNPSSTAIYATVPALHIIVGSDGLSIC